MSHSAVCWQCGASLASLSLPFSRFDACRACGADLHVCRQCMLFASAVAKQCREPIAEEVSDKQRNNVCDYFSPHLGAFQKSGQSGADAARAQLAALFGSQPVISPVMKPDPVQQKADAVATARSALDDLFGKKF